MALEVLKLRGRGFIALNAHPVGCFEEVRGQFAVASRLGGPPVAGTALVIGASTGYGLASRICAASTGMSTIGVMLERPAQGTRTASAGWYNTAAFHELATGTHRSFNADAFADATKHDVADAIGALEPAGLLIYSLASPVRTDPDTGEVYKSALKPIGSAHTTRTIDLDREAIREVTIEPATDDEIRSTVAVMGGDDLERWIDVLVQRGALRADATVIAYSYIGPEVTWPIYRHGTVGRAKEHLEVAVGRVHRRMRDGGGRAFVSVNKAIATQASTAIPAVPLYMSLLFKVMKSKDLHEGAIEQAARLFDRLSQPGDLQLDAEGRLRLDDREMRADIQEDVAELWPIVETENLTALSDFEGFRRDFHRLFGFDVPGVDYDTAVETDVALP
jgi:enoyl-[acyl-carrier protein] reductase/trans-2-enoyl-CoA reductase (NAD+)